MADPIEVDEFGNPVPVVNVPPPKGATSHNGYGDDETPNQFTREERARNDAATASVTAPPPPVPEAWIGQNRGVGRVNIGQQGRNAFNPMNDPRIRRGYDPMADNRFRGVYQDAGQMATRADRERRAIEAMLGRPLQAPNALSPERVRAAQPGAVLNNSGAGMALAQDQIDNFDRSRRAQNQTLLTATDWAQGNMPSVGQDIANEAGVRANEQFLRAGSESNQAYGLAGNEAGRAYSDALANMLSSQQNAATMAGRQTGDAASDAVLRQAALVSGARGGNIGMALRAGLGGAAMQSADANRQSARLMSDANRQAADIAAAGQRAAQATQAQQAMVAQGTQERAGFAASAAEQEARLRAAQIGSQEQQAALALQAQIADQMRGGDVAATGVATNVGQLGLGMDTLATNAGQSDADRALQADQFNSAQGFEAGQFGQEMGFNYDQLNSNNQQFMAGMYQGDQQFGLGMQANTAQFDAQMAQAMAAAQMGSEQQLVELLAGLDEQSRQRVLQDYAIRNDIMNARDAAEQARFDSNVALGSAGIGALGTAAIATAPLWTPSSSSPGGGGASVQNPTGGPTYGPGGDPNAQTAPGTGSIDWQPG